MAAPTRQAEGTFQSGGAIQLTVPWPAHAVDDIGLLFVVSAGTVGNLATDAGFVEGPETPSLITGLHARLFWCRATSTSMTSPVTATGVNNISAVIVTARGCITTGDPWDVTSTNSKTTTSTSLSITGDTTTDVDRLVYYFSARSSDFAANQFSGESDSTLTGLTERVDNGTTTGNGGGIGVWTGTKATAGAYGPLTATIANTSTDINFSIALKPPVSGATGTVAVTQEAQTSTASATQAIPGTSAVTQEPQASTASGSVVGPFVGTVAVTQDSQTSTATAVEGFTGTAAVVQADQTSTASGAETITGTSATTQADQTSIATGVHGSAASGTVATTQDDQTSTASGTVVVVISATGSPTQDDQTSTAAAQVQFVATSATIQDDQVGMGVGGYDFFATSAQTQDHQTSTASGIVAMAVTGTATIIQEDQFATATADGGTVTFWTPDPADYVFDPAAYVPDPAGYVKVGPGDVPPNW